MISFLTANFYLVTGRFRFPAKRVGETIAVNGAGEFTIFREMIKKPRRESPTPGAEFRARFHVTGMSPRANRLFSLLPIPFFSGLPGFRSKLWLVNKEGDFMGIYEWDTEEEASFYSRSFAAEFMSRRSVPGSVTFQVLSKGA